MYPTESLVLFVVDHKESDVERILIEELDKFKTTRKWAIAEPNVVVTDDETFGINITLYSATKCKLPKEIDRL